MTKIMTFGAAALCAAVSLADVTSANVVGYNQWPLRAGSLVTGGQFDKIALENGGVMLTDLVPTGYHNQSEYFKNKATCGMKGYITITILDNGGAVDVDENGNDRTYMWYETYNWNTDPTLRSWANDGCWKQNQGGKAVVITKDNDVKFDQGQGLYVQVTKGFIAGMTITCSGQALLDAQDIDLRSGSKPMIAPLSAPVKLTDIKPIGYHNQSEYFKNKATCGMKGYITITILNNGGSVDVDENGNDRTYMWYETYNWNTDATLRSWANDGCWKQNQGGKAVVITKDNDVEFKLGEGLYVQCTKGYMKGMKLQFPGVDDSATAE